MKVEQAIELAGYGLPLFPIHSTKGQRCSCGNAKCKNQGKHPIVNDWPVLATKEELTLKAWWRTFRNPNGGIACGAGSGIVVVDIDPRNGGDDSLAKLQADYDRFPETAMALTGGGGNHFYFRHPGNIKIKSRTGAIAGYPGIDVKADGGYVVAPGSIHESGRLYEWEASSEPEEAGFRSIPDWLLQLIYQPSAVGQQVETGEEASVIEGGRNQWLISIAGTLRRRGLGYKAISAAIHATNDNHCHPPLTTDEVDNVVKSILRYAPGGRK